MNGGDFLSAARRQAAAGHESDWRSAASRAYYAAFHVARDLLTALGFTTPQADRCDDLYHRLNNCGEAGVQQAASLLHELRGRRNRADYDIHTAFAGAIAARAIAQADDVIRAVDALSSAQRVQITDTMKHYEQGLGDVTWHP